MLNILSWTISHVSRTLGLNMQSYGAIFVDWGDGTVIQATQTLAPDQNTGQLGSYTANHTYAKEGVYEVRVWSNDIKRTRNIWIGRTIPVFDPEKRLPNMKERWDREAARTAAIGQAKRY